MKQQQLAFSRASVLSAEVGHFSVSSAHQQLRGWSPWGCDFTNILRGYV